MGRLQRSIDWLAIAILAGLAAFSIFVLLTVNKEIAFAQGMFFGIGLLLMLFFANWESVLYFWGGWIWYLSSIVLLFVTLFVPTVRGAARWIQVGSAQIQTSEIVKPFLLLTWARAMSSYSPRNIRYFPLHFLLFIVPFILVFKQPDLGSSLIYFAMWLGMMLAGGFPIKYLAAGAILLAVLAPMGWNVLAPYQRSRIETFVNPGHDPAGAGYNALQSTIAVGSGQLWGRGLGRGTQSHLRFLPEYHTDFIFATLVEELGLLGGILLITIYTVLLWWLLSPLLNNPKINSFVFLYTMGVFVMILTQLFINAGMNMGLIPVTGITLPFISYGGSSIVAISIMFGVLFALKRG